MAVRDRLTGGVNSAATTHSVTMPAATVAGDRLVVGVVTDGSSGVSTSSTGWSSLGSTSQGSNHTLTIFTKVATGSDTLSVAIAASQAACWVAIAMNGDGGTPTVSTNSGSSATTGAVTSQTGLTSGNYDAIVFLGLDNSVGSTHTVTPSSGFANAQNVGGSGDPVRGSSADAAFSAVTSVSPASVTWTNAEQWVTALVVISADVGVTVADSGTGTDTFTVVETVTVADTGTGVDAFISSTATVGDSGTGTDTFVAFDGELVGPAGDVGTGTDLFSVVDVASSTLLGALHPAPVYELLVMARIPAAGAPPTMVIVDPIPWTTLDWSTTLSSPQTLDVTCSLSTLTEPVLQRFRRPARLATELWLLRNGQTVFAGPLAGGRRDGEQLQLHADGLLAYLARWRVFSDLAYTAVDQALIVKALVDHWQGRPYGNAGIDTSAIAAVGVTRDATYLATELHPILQRIQELGQRQNGFDVDVDPASRALQIWYPTRGVDRSSGEDAIVFDSRNITSPSTMFSVGPDDVASVAFGTGTSSDVGAGTLYSTKVNAELLAQFGAFAVTGTWDSVKEQATLDGHVQGLLDARADALMVPGPNVRVTPDADLSGYDVGDTVSYDVDDQLGVTGAFRLRSRRVSVSESGQELITPTFV